MITIVKVLVLIPNELDNGGISTAFMNYYRAMDKTDIQIDIASSNQPVQSILDELKENNSEYIQLPEREKVVSYMHKISSIAGNYDVVHINGNSATMILELFPVYRKHVPKRIVECHTTICEHTAINKILSPVFNRLYTQALAVSQEAGEWLFPKFSVLNNAIPVDKYAYDENIRREIRKELKIENYYTVYGHVGCLNDQKNHEFLLQIFQKICHKNPNSLLLLVGDGPLKNRMIDLSVNLRISRNIRFLGEQSNSAEMLQAMDCFIFPSKYEGFGLAVLEAQANGLKCFVSDKVPDDAIVLENVEKFSLDDDKQNIAERICSADYSRIPIEQVTEKINKKHLNVNLETKTLKDFYTG